MFRLAEAFIEFVTRGYQEAVSQLARAAVEAQQFGAEAMAAAGQSEALSRGLVLIGTDAAVASAKVTALTASVERLAGRMGGMRRIGGGGVIDAEFVNHGPQLRLPGPAAAQAVARNWDEAAAAAMRFARALSATGVGGAALSMISGGVMAISKAAQAATAALSAMGVTLTISTGGLFAILAGIVAALVAIGAAFKAAFAGDMEAQRAVKEIGENIHNILTIVGGPLVAAFKSVALPLAEMISLTDRLIRQYDRLTGQIRTVSTLFQLMAAHTLNQLRTVERLAEWMGLLAPERLPGGKDATEAQAGSRVGLEEFEKQIASAIGRAEEKELAKRQVAALEDIQRQGVVIRNANEIRQPAPGFAP